MLLTYYALYITAINLTVILCLFGMEWLALLLGKCLFVLSYVLCSYRQTE